MQLEITDSGLPIVQLSTCFKNLLLNFKAHYIVNSLTNFLKINS